MKRIILSVCILSFILASGCDVPSKGVRAYFYKDGKLEHIERTIPTVEKPLLIAITKLMEGPYPEEKMNGFTTEIPEGTRAIRISRAGNTAIVDLNAAIREYKGDNEGVQRMLAQIIYTATSIRGISSVLLRIQGRDSFTLGREDYLVDRPLDRSDI